ncbi:MULTISPECIES: hypothetical protein [Bacillus cereus group]|uniref:hypothetical protein n=1 Tax=Bacillus cereus group TaxID=86661 RepID=UPI0024C77233|nr:hypothetical protein [Bacillus paranthracis]MED1681015.1 hypothetical protein [Bacillus paranthracis]WAI25988.1 MAG: hypothetical protein NRZ50_23840 [Bacillus paranthracis]WAI31045.1 MAG: hypothetical protein NRZ52_19455 [Bacillus paranthracis]WAI40804.1 MAG: hypothetical protein NRZ51_13085 [Bacillus paranthracis]
MFYNNQPPYPQQPFYPQQQEQRYTEQYEEQELQQQEQQYEQNPYATTQYQAADYPQNPYTAPQNQEQQFQQNPYVTPQTQPQQPQYQQQMYQPNYDARVSPPKPPTLDITQPQILPPGPTLDITQPQILPPGPITEPTQQQIQQVVGTQFLPLKKPVLDFVKPWVDYGLNEAKHTSYKHALTEVAAIMFLVGKGFNPTIAHYIVESWEKNEQF